MEKERIVVTGMGVVTPIGVGVDNFWHNLLEGVSGTTAISRFNTENLPVKIAAEVKNFNPTDYMPKKLVRETDPFMHYAFAAAKEALAKAQLKYRPERIGIVLGTCLAGITTITQTQDSYTSNPTLRVSPYFVPKSLGNIAAAQIAIANDFKGPSYTINTACSSSADAIGLASMLLLNDEADAFVVVGAESILCSLMTAGLAQAKALSTRNDQPEKACRPFDLNRDGFIMGEGAGAVILETLSQAKARGAEIQGELLGYSSTSDAYHITSPEPTGEGEIRCMQQALAKAGLTINDIDYINAHGTSTKIGDVIETQAIKSVFGERSGSIPVSSTKGATGHMIGASGIVEFITCIKTIADGIVPPTLNLEFQDPLCDLDYVPAKARKLDIKIAMSNSFGFGGQNASLIAGKYFD